MLIHPIATSAAGRDEFVSTIVRFAISGYDMSDRRKKQAVTVLICCATMVALGAAAQMAGPVAASTTAVSSAAANLLGNGGFESALAG